MLGDGLDKSKYRHPLCRNNNSLGVELCSRKDPEGNYYFIAATVDRAVSLVKELMKKYGVPADHVLRHSDVTGKKCLPLDSTELLAPSGWVHLGSVASGDKIATYSPKSERLRFAPVQFFVEPYTATVYRARKLEATGNHNMLFRPNCINSRKWKTKSYDEFFHGNKQWQVLGCSDMYNDGIPLTDMEIRLLVWIQGDGSYENGSVRFHFSKERKILQLTELLSDMRKDFSVYQQADGTAKIDIRDRGDTLKWAETWLSEKDFTFKLLGMNERQANIFLEELIHVDGSAENNSYFSMRKANTDFVQALASINGVRALEYVQPNGLHVVSLNDCKYYIITHNEDESKKQTKTSTRNTSVGCVTVEDGYILIRQNGQVSIVGNCPVPFVDSKAEWEDFKKRLEGTGVTVQEAKKIVQDKAGLAPATMAFLECYKYADELLVKLAGAMK